MANATIEDRLSRFWVFEGFSQEELQQAAGFVEEETFSSGRILFRQGDMPDFFYLVERGAVQEIGRDQGGQAMLCRTAEAGDFTDSRALMNETPRPTTATVARTARTLAINAHDFKTLLAMFPQLRQRLQRTEVINRLLGIPLFSSFTREQLPHVADLLRVVEYPEGQTIFHQGDLADAFYVIDIGQVVEDVTGTVLGAEAWPKYLSAGSFFGRYALLKNTTRRATARAMTDVRLFRFGAEAFDWLRQLQPEFEKALRRHDVLGCLRQTRICAQLNDEELRHLAGFVGLAHFGPGDVLYRQGEIDPTLYILYEGEAIVRARDEAGQERPRDYLRTGDALGEASLFLKEPRDVTVEATTETNWLYLTRADLDQFLAQRPEVVARAVPREEVKAKRGLRRFQWMDLDEQAIMVRRRHWFFFAYRLSWPTLLLMVVFFIWLFLPWPRFVTWSLLSIAVAWIVWRVIDWLNDYYVITTSRVAHQEKLLLIRETRDETPLDKVQNVNVVRGLVGNAFGFGTLLIDTAAVYGAARVTFDFLADPEQVQALIFEQVSRAHAGERVEMRRAIREKLEKRVGVGIRPTVPRPAVSAAEPPLSLPPPPPRPGILERIGAATWQRAFWIQKRVDGQVTWRKHWIRLLRRIWMPLFAVVGLLTVLGFLVVGVEGGSVWLVFLLMGLLMLALGWLWWNWEDWGNDLYILTDDRIIDTKALPLGFSSQRTDTTFDRIQNVSFEIPNPVATLLNYGTVIIYTAGAEGRLDFEWVRDPSGVQAEIFRRLGEYEEAQRHQQREDRWADLPEWFAEYERRQRS